MKTVDVKFSFNHSLKNGTFSISLGKENNKIKPDYYSTITYIKGKLSVILVPYEVAMNNIKIKKPDYIVIGTWKPGSNKNNSLPADQRIQVYEIPDGKIKDFFYDILDIIYNRIPDIKKIFPNTNDPVWNNAVSDSINVLNDVYKKYSNDDIEIKANIDLV